MWRGAKQQAFHIAQPLLWQKGAARGSYHVHGFALQRRRHPSSPTVPSCLLLRHPSCCPARRSEPETHLGHSSAPGVGRASPGLSPSLLLILSALQLEGGFAFLQARDRTDTSPLPRFWFRSHCWWKRLAAWLEVGKGWPAAPHAAPNL